MLFNSYTFILIYLPCVFAGFLVSTRIHQDFGILWLFLASLFFYGWWDDRYILLLFPSIAFNFFIGRGLSAIGRPPLRRRALLVFGITCDLTLLAFFKYADFFIGTVNNVSGGRWSLLHVILPLGISFFTFTQ